MVTRTSTISEVTPVKGGAGAPGGSFNPDEPRDDKGKWTGGGGPNKPPPSGGSGDRGEWKNPKFRLASDTSGTIPQRDGQVVPVRPYTGYHVTTHENAAEILKNGFDLSMVSPRWLNDLAVSVAPSAKAAAKFFTSRAPGATFDSAKYTILRVSGQGRSYNDSRDEGIGGNNARSYSEGMLRSGYDLNSKVGYIYNTNSIRKISAVSL